MKGATDIPVLFAIAGGDPVELGLVEGALRGQRAISRAAPSFRSTSREKGSNCSRMCFLSCANSRSCRTPIIRANDRSCAPPERRRRSSASSLSYVPFVGARELWTERLQSSSVVERETGESRAAVRVNSLWLFFEFSSASSWRPGESEGVSKGWGDPLRRSSCFERLTSCSSLSMPAAAYAGQPAFYAIPQPEFRRQIAPRYARAVAHIIRHEGVQRLTPRAEIFRIESLKLEINNLQFSRD